MKPRIISAWSRCPSSGQHMDGNSRSRRRCSADAQRVAAFPVGFCHSVADHPMEKIALATGRGLHATLLLSLSMIAVPSALTFWSEQRLSSGLTALIFGAMPLMTACLTPLMAGRWVPRRAWEAMIVGLGGLGLVMSGAISTSLWQAVGAVAVLLAVAMYAASSVYAKEALAGVHPFVSTAIQFFWRHLVSACQHGIRARPTFNMEHAGNCRAGVPERLRKRIEFHSVLLAACNGLRLTS